MSTSAWIVSSTHSSVVSGKRRQVSSTSGMPTITQTVSRNQVSRSYGRMPDTTTAATTIASRTGGTIRFTATAYGRAVWFDGHMDKYRWMVALAVASLAAAVLVPAGISQA